MDNAIIAAIVAMAAAFLTVRLVKTFRGKRPPCCSGPVKDRNGRGEQQK
jgi:hypothetical protein